MMNAIDRMVLTNIAQPAVDAFQIDVDTYPRSLVSAAATAFIVSTLGFVTLFMTVGMPWSAATALIVGLTHGASVGTDAMQGKMRKDDMLASMGRLVQMFELIGGLVFLVCVSDLGSPIWTVLTAVFVAGVALSTVIAYISICDAPPPPRQDRRTALSSI